MIVSHVYIKAELFNTGRNLTYPVWLITCWVSLTFTTNLKEIRIISNFKDCAFLFKIKYVYINLPPPPTEKPNTKKNCLNKHRRDEKRTRIYCRPGSPRSLINLKSIFIISVLPSPPPAKNSFNPILIYDVILIHLILSIFFVIILFILFIQI